MSTQIIAQQIKPQTFQAAALNSAMLEHLANIIKDTYPELESRVDRAVLIVHAGDVLPGRGEIPAPSEWIGGQGPTPQTAMEVAQAVPHHKSSQDAYSIIASYYCGEYPEYFCTCADSRGEALDGRAPYVPGIGTCCKHVLAVVLLVQLAPDLASLRMTERETLLAERCIKAGILDQRPDHPLSRCLLAHRIAVKAASLFGSTCEWHQRIAWFEKFQAGLRLAEWRTSEHWQKYIGGGA
jgi:hypothetical protein